MNDTLTAEIIGLLSAVLFGIGAILTGRRAKKNPHSASKSINSIHHSKIPADSDAVIRLEEVRLLTEGLHSELEDWRASISGSFSYNAEAQKRIDACINTVNENVESTGIAELKDISADRPDWLGLAKATVVNVLTGVKMDVAPEHARIFYSTAQIIDNHGTGSFTFELNGNKGSQQFTLACGTSQTNIVRAFNHFQLALGISSTIDSNNPDLVRIDSLETGSDQFVGIKRVTNNVDKPFYDQNRSNPANSQTDYGA